MGSTQNIEKKLWSEAEIDYLRNNWGKVRAKVIGDFLGRSKNSVISRAHRINLPSYGKKLQVLEYALNKRRETQRKLKKNNSFFEAKIQKAKEAASIKPENDPYMAVKVAIEPINGTGIKFMDLKRSHCRWVTEDDVHFCGHPVKEGQSYCPGHYSVVYRPVVRKKKR